MSQGTENKHTGSFYTPTWCVDLLLRISGYDDVSAPALLNMKVMDPACGDGAILCRIAEKSIRLMRESDIADSDISYWIENNLRGIELDAGEARKCEENIARVCDVAGLDVDTKPMHIICGDALTLYEQMTGSFDFVIGNPPYVRIHNLDEKPASQYITGMCDLYYAFYDIGQQLLRDTGRMCFIAPSSWMTNEAGSAMRDAIRGQGNITDILDFAHYQVFDNATTYTAIVALDSPSAPPTSFIRRWVFDDATKTAHVDDKVTPENAWCAGKFYAKGSSALAQLLSFDAKSADNSICVRNGYATLLDKAYISKDGIVGCEKLEIDVVKASKATRNKAIYPYKPDGSLIPIDDIRECCPAAYEHLISNKDKLLARNKIDPSKWWAYGRTQGIADTYADKYTVQSIIRPGKKIEIAHAPAGTGVYGGLYVIGMKKDELRDAIDDPLFTDYVMSLAKYKSGGYYAFSGKELERYLRFWRSRRIN